jgi:hypothetical protein
VDPESKSNASYYKEFDCSDIFFGFSIETRCENEDTLRSMPGVANVWPMRSVPLAPVAKRRIVSREMGAKNYSMHHYTGVDKLHAEGIRGQGVKIAVIDTGIDYTHEAVRSLSTKSSMSANPRSWEDALAQAARSRAATIS